jgi:hypothetical protein
MNRLGGTGLHYDADTLARMRSLWEGSPELSAKAIGERFGVTKNVIIGQANRRGWMPRPSPLKGGRRTTILDRLDALDTFPPTGRCVYPIGHPKSEGFRFCGDRVAEVGAPYCAACCRKCWTGTGPAKQREAWENDPERRLKAAAHARKVAAGKQRGSL